jgi:hypothetical protein
MQKHRKTANHHSHQRLGFHKQHARAAAAQGQSRRSEGAASASLPQAAAATQFKWKKFAKLPKSALHEFGSC